MITGIGFQCHQLIINSFEEIVPSLVYIQCWIYIIWLFNFHINNFIPIFVWWSFKKSAQLIVIQLASSIDISRYKLTDSWSYLRFLKFRGFFPKTPSKGTWSYPLSSMSDDLCSLMVRQQRFLFTILIPVELFFFRCLFHKSNIYFCL